MSNKITNCGECPLFEYAYEEFEAGVGFIGKGKCHKNNEEVRETKPACDNPLCETENATEFCETENATEKESITLIKFLKTKTNAKELCVITESGWIVATFWIDYEDLFCGYVNNNLAQMEIKSDKWDYLSIVNENNATIKIPAHFINL